MESKADPVQSPASPLRIVENSAEADGDTTAQRVQVKPPPMAWCQPESLRPKILSLLEAISAIRGRPTFAIISKNIDESVPAQIHMWREHLAEKGETGEVDVLIHSPGGYLNDCYRSARLLSLYCPTWNAIVPVIAASGATLICLGSNTVVMPDPASLGPIDPQVASKRAGKFYRVERQSPLEAFQAVRYMQRFALQVVDSGLRFLTNDQMITPQTALNSATDLAARLSQPILEKIDPYDLGAFQMDTQLSENYAMRIADPLDPGIRSQRNVQVTSLANYYPSHSFHIDRMEAEVLGFRVEKPDDRLSEILDGSVEILETVSCFIGGVGFEPQEKTDVQEGQTQGGRE